jgi:hypothetical protein
MVNIKEATPILKPPIAKKLAKLEKLPFFVEKTKRKAR